MFKSVSKLIEVLIENKKIKSAIITIVSIVTCCYIYNNESRYYYMMLEINKNRAIIAEYKLKTSYLMTINDNSMLFSVKKQYGKIKSEDKNDVKAIDLAESISACENNMFVKSKSVILDNGKKVDMCHELIKYNGKRR